MNPSQPLVHPPENRGPEHPAGQIAQGSAHPKDVSQELARRPHPRICTLVVRDWSIPLGLPRWPKGGGPITVDLFRALAVEQAYLGVFGQQKLQAVEIVAIPDPSRPIVGLNEHHADAARTKSFFKIVRPVASVEKLSAATDGSANSPVLPLPATGTPIMGSLLCT